MKESAFYDGIPELLHTLMQSKDAILCIATLKTQKQMDVLSTLFDLPSYFDVILGTTEDGSLKKWQMLESLREKYGDANNTFYICKRCCF